jgi:hypothetical protein
LDRRLHARHLKFKAIRGQFSALKDLFPISSPIIWDLNETWIAPFNGFEQGGIKLVKQARHPGRSPLIVVIVECSYASRYTTPTEDKLSA